MSTPTSDPTKFGSGMDFDQALWAEIIDLVTTSGVGQREVIENFPLFLRRVNLAKFLAHVEIFQKTVGRPGCIVECGVFQGLSLLTFTKLVEILCPGDTLKRVIGFDTFHGFVGLDAKDGPPNARRGKVVGGWNAADFLPTLQRVVEITQRDSMIPRFQRVELVQGDVKETIPAYVARNPGLRIALLHLDMDLYEPTLCALRHLYPLVVPGGVVLLDEYGMDGFPGESAAFDEYFGGQRPVLTKFPYISTPGGYFLKAG
ncbi:MAG: class I SAM-dependent methyltransferase [Anaerolineales bacterium]|nr:class I SAM-dependent methyltransferase [Anaerolineales bacterium]